MNGSMDVKISSTQTKTVVEANNSLTDALIDKSFAACESLPPEEDFMCCLEVARKYRGSHLVKKCAGGKFRGTYTGWKIGAHCRETNGNLLTASRWAGEVDKACPWRKGLVYLN